MNVDGRTFFRCRLDLTKRLEDPLCKINPLNNPPY